LGLYAQTTSVLFLGNSYTYSNNLPDLVKYLSLSAGDSVVYDMNCPGGYTLQMHCNDVNSISKINSRPWDFVVIQCQSQEPSLDTPYVVQNVFPYAHYLDSVIHHNDSCTQVVFYMTWGRKFGDASNCAAYPPVCTYSGMQEQLRNRYLQMAVDNDAMVAPVGAAWQHVIATNPVFDLYQADYSHPSLYGSYLAACVFYSTIFRQSSSGLPYYGGLTQSEANFLQDQGSHTVLDSMTTWRTEAHYPVASFTWNNSSGNTIDCSASSAGITSFEWNDGVGSGFFSGTQNQTITYSGPGLYLVTLVVSNGCFTDTLSQNVTVGPSGIHNLLQDSIRINTIDEGFSITSFTDKRIVCTLFYSDGKQLDRRTLIENGTTIIPVTQSGVYFLLVENEDTVQVLKKVFIR
jgi:hypothetical protein